MDLSQSIEIVENISNNHFEKKYFDTQTPVIIKGLTKNTIAGQKWTIDYFKNTMGDILVDIFDNQNKKAAASAFTSSDIKMKFKDYLDIISKNEHTGLRIFLCNLFKINPQLRKEFPCPDIFKSFLGKVGFMFFGGKDTTVRTHYYIDMSNVLHTHFGGRKRVILISKEYSELLYRLPLNTYSLVDLDNPDYDKYPGLEYVKGYTAILEPGDTIFMPAGYWHYMTYLEGSFSVSYRKVSPNIAHTAEGLLNLVVYMPVDKFLNWFMGKMWLQTKITIAQKRASRLLNKQYRVDLETPLGI